MNSDLMKLREGTHQQAEMGIYTQDNLVEFGNQQQPENLGTTKLPEDFMVQIITPSKYRN